MAIDDIVVAATLVGLVLGIVAIIVIYRRRYVRIPPNRALVVYRTRSHARPQSRVFIATGGKRFVRPIIEANAWLSLKDRRNLSPR